MTIAANASLTFEYVSQDFSQILTFEGKLWKRGQSVRFEKPL
jgi:hypothetical protein